MPQLSSLRFAMESEPSPKDVTHKGEPPAPQPAAGAVPSPRPRGAHRRFGETLATVHRRVHRPRARSAEPVWPRAFDRLLLLGLLLVAALSLFDAAATRHARADDGLLFSAMRAITDIGQSHWYLVPAALLFVAAAFVDWRAAGFRGRRRLVLLLGQAGFAFAAVALSGLLANLVKIVVGRARPQMLDAFGAHHFEPFSLGYAFASFPSGHATTVGAVTALLVLWFPRYAALWAIVGVFLAATRVAATAHYLSDIAGGFLFGLGFTILAARFLARRGVAFRFARGKILPVVVGRRTASRK